MSHTSRFNFTKTSLAALPNAAPGSRDTHFDTRTRGLMVLVTPSGRKAFYVRRKVKGRSERIYIGRFPDDWSVERARGRADEINASIGHGENPAETRRTKRAEMTLDTNVPPGMSAWRPTNALLGPLGPGAPAGPCGPAGPTSPSPAGSSCVMPALHRSSATTDPLAFAHRRSASADEIPATNTITTYGAALR